MVYAYNGILLSNDKEHTANNVRIETNLKNMLSKSLETQKSTDYMILHLYKILAKTDPVHSVRE